MRKTNDIDVNIILDKFNSGKYTYGQNKMLDKGDLDLLSRPVIEWFKRTPEICSNKMNDGGFRLADVPEFSRIPDFFITTYPHHQIYAYLSKYNVFDRDFYKDLICSNRSALNVKSNIFDIMPLEYIDEEMIDLAVVSSIGTNNFNWILAVILRKQDSISPEALRAAVRHVKLNDETTLKHYYSREEEFKRLSYTFHKLRGLTGNSSSLPVKFLDDEYTVYVPALYEGDVPVSVSTTYDRDEYLAYIYAKYGIKIIERVNEYFYKVQLPEGFSCVERDPIGFVLDNDGNEIVKFRYSDNKFNCFAFATTINDQKRLVMQ